MNTKLSFSLIFAIVSSAVQSQNCTYNGQTYSEGSVICTNNWEYRCNAGSWDYLGTSCGLQVAVNETKESSSSPMKTVVFSNPDKNTDENKVAKKNMLPCVSMFSLGSFTKVGLRNNCDQCKEAVIMWIGVGQRVYRVKEYGSIEIDIISHNGQIIGENPCR